MSMFPIIIPSEPIIKPKIKEIQKVEYFKLPQEQKEFVFVGEDM